MAILGIDEVGRGPWAGPLVIGAVILPDHQKYPWIAELTDSKKLSAKKREKLNEIILKEAPATGLGWVSSKELDEIGLSSALRLAARRAVEEVQKKHVSFTEIIIDGTQNFLVGTRLEKYVTHMPKADFLIKEVSAASIIAKVARDNYMCELAKKYPNYGFEKHVGYGTAAHKTALIKCGACPEHRFSFRPVAEIVKNTKASTENTVSLATVKTNAVPKISKITTRKIGDKAENKVADFLVKNGHQIIARNAKTKFYEIDIVSTKNDVIYFTEVKYRKNSLRGTPLEMITKEKQAQMQFAAEAFLKYHKEFSKYNPILAAAAVSGENFTIEKWIELK